LTMCEWIAAQVKYGALKSECLGAVECRCVRCSKGKFFSTPIKISELFWRGVIVFTTCVNNTIGRPRVMSCTRTTHPTCFPASGNSRFLQATKTIRIKAAYASHLLRHNTILRVIDVK
ncbi:hypothetical protein M405DRAFT_819590, partial [Rhizopogon salebrosus TDB-379]